MQIVIVMMIENIVVINGHANFVFIVHRSQVRQGVAPNCQMDFNALWEDSVIDQALAIASRKILIEAINLSAFADPVNEKLQWDIQQFQNPK